MKQVAGAAVLVLALVGCGDSGTDDERRAGGSPEPSTTSTTSTPSTPTTELPEPEPTVEPASGPRLSVNGVAVRVPEGWRRFFTSPFSDTAQGPQGTVIVTAIAGESMSLDALRKRDMRATGPLTEVRERPSVSLGGFSAYHYTARTNPLDLRYAYGMYDAGYRVWIHFDLADRVPAATRQQLVDSVLATYESP